MSTSKLTIILDELAPIKTFQTCTNYAPWLGKETKLLKKEREAAQAYAAQTDDPEDWRLFRSLRNQVVGRSRAVKKNWEDQKLDSGDMWKTVKSLLGWKNTGPPTQLFYEGRIVTRPAGLASSMNRFFVDKVRGLRNNIPVVASDPL